MDESLFNELPESERASFMDDCFAYDDELRRGGHFLAGEALQHSSTAVTVRSRNGHVKVTDGPFAETKELLGGIMFLQARDLNHAIQLMSRHPGIRVGSFEIRPADEETNALIAARNS
jgi:hypothetical protein